MNLVFQFLFANFNLIGVTDMIPGLIVFFSGCSKVHLAPSLTNILLVICTLAVGLLMFVGSCAAFRAGMRQYEGAGS